MRDYPVESVTTANGDRSFIGEVRNWNCRHLLRIACLLILALNLAACGGGGDGDSSPSESVSISGGGVKGPYALASVQVFAFDRSRENFQSATPLGSGKTDSNARLNNLTLSAMPDEFPLIVVFNADDDTVDLTTGKRPSQPGDITTLKTVVTRDRIGDLRSNNTPIYATPLTSIAVDLAIARSGTDASATQFLSNLHSAQREVVNMLGFGMSLSTDIFQASPMVNADTDKLVEQTRVGEYRTAVEATGAMVAELRNQTMNRNPNSTVSSDGLLHAIAMDLKDGKIDGKDSGGELAALVDVPSVPAVFAQDPSQLPILGTNLVLGDIESLLVSEAELTGAGTDTSFLENDIDIPISRARLTDIDYPKVVGAKATSNTTVLVTFSKAMQPSSAENTTHYGIRQENVNSEVGKLIVQDARMTGEANNAVELTTTPQNEVGYKLVVTNVTDVYGNQLQVDTGVSDFLTANTASFSGIAPEIILACSANAYGGLSGTACNIDSDCWNPSYNEQTDPLPEATCDVVSNGYVDSDGDGITDEKELRGSTIIIAYSNGEIEHREVTSSPFNSDTDGDGVSDYDELRYGGNPRDADTDSDGLDDNTELNIVLSSPFSADSDGDSIEDGLEHFNLHTSPILADTDGDKLNDDVELFELNRDPLVADLPKLSIEVGDVRLQLDERYTYTDETGNTVTQESSTNTTLTQSDNSSFSHSEGKMNEVTAGGTVGFEVGDAAAFGTEKTTPTPTGKAFGSATVSGTNGTNSQTTSASARESQQAYERSLNKGEEFTTNSVVTREVVDARLDVDVSIENVGNVPFTVSNLEITVLEPSPIDSHQFVPVATLVANSELISGTPLTVNLGPFNTKRGPFLFANREIFPNLVEALMRNPKGLIFRVANYDVSDELGRNFAFSNQVARDRTTGIVIDLGDKEAAKTYYVAGSGALDDQGLGGKGINTYVGGFTGDGRTVGLPLDYILQARLGLQRHDTSTDTIAPGPNRVLDSTLAGDDSLDGGVITTGLNGWLETTPQGDDVVTNPAAKDGIVAGLNQTADSIAQGDDIQQVPVDTTGISVGTVVVGAGENGVLDTPALKDDKPDFVTGYETGRTCSALSENAGELCRVDTDCDSVSGAPDASQASCSGPQRLTRINSLRTGDYNRDWFVFTSGQVPAAADFGKITVKPGDDITMAFLQDLDQDGIFARDEYLAGTIDSAQDKLDNSEFGVSFDDGDTCIDGCDGYADSKDSDRDGLGDFGEIRVGWKVSSDGGALQQVYSNPALRDSDGDGLLDPEEQDLTDYCLVKDPRKDGLCAFLTLTGSVNKDRAVSIIAGNDGMGQSIAGDTNGDGTLDDNDGESDDILVLPPGVPLGGVSAAVIQPGPNGKIETATRGDDLYVSSTFVPPATNPSQGDSDQDGVSDYDELNGYDVGLAIIDGGNGLVDTYRNGDDIQKAPINNPIVEGGIVILPGPNATIDSQNGGDDVIQNATAVTTDPLRRDTDNDTNTDGRELAIGSDPTIPDGEDFRDSDHDGLTDAEETQLGWTVSVDGATRTVLPSPSLVDTDSDGLPDFIERDLRTDPNNADTDNDGISDYDEVNDFERFVRLLTPYPNVTINGSGSERYGTSPVKKDSDGDTLSDYQELIEGYTMTLPGDTTPRVVFTSPHLADTDGDGISDKAEVSRTPAPTDPTNNDTDGDGRTESQEAASGSNPLVPDIAATISFEKVAIGYVTGDGANGKADFTWWFTTRGPSDTTPTLLTSPSCAYLDATGRGCYYWPDLVFDGKANKQCYNVPLSKGVSYALPLKNSSRTFVLQPGQSFRLEGILGEIDTVSNDCGLPPYYIPVGLGDAQGGNVGCVSQVSELFTYERLVSQQGTQLIEIEKTDACEVTFQYSITLE